MTKEEAIKYLKQLYPNGGHCWLDEQRIEAISMAISALEHEEPVSEDLEEAASMYAKEEYSRKNPATLPDRCIGCYAPIMYAFINGAKWKKEQMMKNAVSCEVWDEEPPHITYFPKDMKGHDKCKLIIIKED